MILEKGFTSQNEKIFIAGSMLLAVLLGFALVNVNFIMLALLASPALLLVSIRKPFIFPLGVYALLTPFDNMLAASKNIAHTDILTYLGLFVLLVFLLKGSFEGRLKRPDRAVLWLGLLIAWELTSMVWAIDFKLSFHRLPTALILYGLFFVVSAYRADKSDLKLLKGLIAAGGLIAAFFVIYAYWRYGLANNLYRATLDYGGRWTDPNEAALSLILPMAICLESVLTCRSKILKVLSAAALGIIAFGIITTGSRGGLLGASTVFLVTFFYLEKKKGVLAVMFMIVMAVAPFLPGFFMTRIDTAAATGGAGRLTLWYVGLQSLKKFWLTGAGLSNFPRAYVMFINYAPLDHWHHPDVAHNIFLEIAVELGVFGLALFLWILWKFYGSIKSQFMTDPSGALMLKSAFTGLLVSSFFLSAIWTKPFWLVLMMISISGSVSSQRTPERR